MEKIGKIREKNKISKRNTLNEIRNSNPTLQELRFLAIYLSIINPFDSNSRIVRFSLKKFKEIMELKRDNINQLQDTTNKLLTKVVNIPNERGGYEGFQLFKECRVDKDDNNGWYVEIDAHDKALPLFFEFKNKYFSYQLVNALRLKSANQIRMYELLKQYQSVGYRIIEIDDLKEFLGIEKNKYSRFGNFKIWVLDACQEALKTYTDIEFNHEPYGKKGRGGKIFELKFFIKANKNFKDPLKVEEFIDSLTDANVNPKEIFVEGTELVVAPITVAELEKKISAILEKAPELPSTPIEPTVLAEKMYSYYKSLDWHTSTGRPIKNWTALVRKWIKDEKAAEKVNKPNNRRSKFHNFTQKSTDYAELEKMNQQLMLEEAKKLGI